MLTLVQAVNDYLPSTIQDESPILLSSIISPAFKKKTNQSSNYFRNPCVLIRKRAQSSPLSWIPKADIHDEVLHFWGKKGVEVFVFHLHLTRSTSGLVLEEEVITNPSLPASLDMDEQTKQFLPQSSSTLEILCWNTTSVNHRGKSRPSWFYRLFFQNRYCVALQKIRSEAAGVPSFSRTCFLLENFT